MKQNILSVSGQKMGLGLTNKNAKKCNYVGQVKNKIYSQE